MDTPYVTYARLPSGLTATLPTPLVVSARLPAAFTSHEPGPTVTGTAAMVAVLNTVSTLPDVP